ncbi:MAG: competence/damage-inducible protein A [Gammaproteobacteria bacterium]
MIDQKQPFKNISFLATGNEIIEGEVQDTNGQYFAATLHDKGAKLYQHVHVSDDRDDICTALRYLLEHSDVVITTGGLGPTSDDNTRFAVAEETGCELKFDEPSWETIRARMATFNLKAVDSNRQQALFPEGADIYPNANGSAPACHLAWKGKHIFMLPGPPRECRPIFDSRIMPMLESLSFFDKRERFQWITMGLSESEIAETIDAMANPHGFETGYRWSYPYLTIKVMAKDKHPDTEVLSAIDALLEPYCVSRDRKNALEVLDDILMDSSETIFLVDEINAELASPLVTHPNIIPIDRNGISKKGLIFVVASLPKISKDLNKPGSIAFSCEGFLNGERVYQHQFSVPMRGAEIIHSARAYTAWQLGRYLSLNRF